MRTKILVGVLFGITLQIATSHKDEVISPISEVPVQAEEKTSEAVELQDVAPKDQQVEKMLDYIHQAESSSGNNTNPNALHNICKSQGKSNEYGYGGMAKKYCYKDEETARDVVRQWINRKLDLFSGDVGKTLCYYNLGQRVSDCPYARNYYGM